MNPLSTFKKAKSKIRRQRYPLKNIASNINPKIFMKLGIISDIHDKVDILRKALDILQKTDALICCGDLCSPFVIRELGTHYNKEIHLVLGNNDADIFTHCTAPDARHGFSVGAFCVQRLHGHIIHQPVPCGL